MKRDALYARQLDEVAPFVFDETVAGVFDDMIERSIPAYPELIRSQAAL